MVTAAAADLNHGSLEKHSVSPLFISEHSGMGNLNLADVRGLAPSQDSLKGFPDGQYLLANMTDEKSAVLQATGANSGAEQSGGTVVEYPSGGSVEASGGCGKTKIKAGDDGGSYDVTVEPPKNSKKNGSCTIKVTPPEGKSAGIGHVD